MLRRLGLVKGVNGENGHSAEAAGGTFRAPTHVTAPSVDPHLNSRYFKVVYRGAVAVRSNPAEPAPEVGQVSKHVNTTKHTGSIVTLLLCVYSHLSYHTHLSTRGGAITGRFIRKVPTRSQFGCEQGIYNSVTAVQTVT